MTDQLRRLYNGTQDNTHPHYMLYAPKFTSTPTMISAKRLILLGFLCALQVSSISAFTQLKRPSFVQNQRSSSSLNVFEYALIFDCDGVIIETEELHRLAYNAAFKEAGVEVNGNPVEWSVEYYDVLQNTVGGGKPKMFYHFRETLKAFPVGIDTEEKQQGLIDDLQANKTELYKKLVTEKATPRPGVIELMDEAIAAPDIAVGVCSASTKAAVTKVLETVLGKERREKLNVCLLGDDVPKLKPDPMIYSTAAERLGIDPSRCVVVEDSIVGLKAAKGAKMKCLITYTLSTESEDFYGQGADAKVPELGDKQVTLDSIFGPMKEKGVDAEICVGLKD